MANWSGITATLAALARPRTLQPNLVVPSIANLDWHRLRHHAGVHAVVVDKDNCIAKPNEDDLANSDELRRAWAELLDTFGTDNVLVVSNTAGDLRKDPLLIQAETVSRNLRVPVLVHRFPKPGQSCARQIAAHFLLPRSSSTALSSPASASSAPQTRPHSPSLAGQTIFSPLARSFLPSTRFSSPARITSNSSAPLRLLVIGDRLSTDMILSSRLSALRLPFSLPSNSSTPFWRRLRGGKVEVGSQGGKVECVGVLTTKLWGRDGAGTALMRLVERVVVRFMGTRSTADGEVRWEEYVKGHQAGSQRAEARAGQVVEPSLPSTSPSTPRQSGLSLSLPSLSTLRALPFSLTHSLQTLPSHHSSLVHSIPLQISSLTSRLLTRLFSALETHLPRLLARLHAPMSRVVRIYTDPTSLAPAPSPSTASSVQERGKGLVERAERRLDRWIDAAEKTWDEAGRRIDSLEVERLGAKIAEARRAVRESAEGLRERLWRLKAGGQGRVER